MFTIRNPFRRKPNYAHIAQLEREMGIDDETLMQQWIESADRELEQAKPKRREFFKPPIIEPKPLLTQHAVSASSFSFAPGAVKIILPPNV